MARKSTAKKPGRKTKLVESVSSIDKSTDPPTIKANLIVEMNRMPIATAPMDGTPIIVFDEEYAGPEWVYIAYVHETLDDRIEWVMLAAVHISDKFYSSGISGRFGRNLEPTAWRSITG